MQRHCLFPWLDATVSMRRVSQMDIPDQENRKSVLLDLAALAWDLEPHKHTRSWLSTCTSVSLLSPELRLVK